MKSRSCAEIEKYLPLHAGGDLNNRDTQRVEAHLRECPQCLASADQLLVAREDLKLFTAPKFDERFYANIRNSVLSEINLSTPRLGAFESIYSLFRSSNLAWAATAVAVILCAAPLISTIYRRAEVMPLQKSASIAPTIDVASKPTAPQQQEESPARSEEAAANSPVVDKDKPRVRTISSHTVVRSVNRTKTPEIDSVSVALTGTAAPYQLFQTKALAGEEQNLDAVAEPKQLRIELQTKDPNIRIIWLAPARP